MLSEAEKIAVRDAVRAAELNTSGEIRVHVDRDCEGDPVQRAVEVFEKLEMHATALKNGVLIYVAFNSKKLAIIGDSGINEKVEADFWNSTRDKLVNAFKSGDYAKGICAAVEEAGSRLSNFFPRQTNDNNELSDEISTGL